jgi:chromate transporter
VKLVSVREVFLTSLRLGLTSFGGPIAHLGYFERAYVRQRGWLTGADFASLVALCQSLPGPTSSQVGFLIGLHRAGWPGAFAAWLGFTLPSAFAMYACATLMPWGTNTYINSTLHGLMITAVAVVAQAVTGMARTLCPDWQRVTLATLSCATLLLIPSPATQLAAMLCGALGGLWLCATPTQSPSPSSNLASLGPSGPARGISLLVLYILVLIALPALALLAPHGPTALVALFYRAGALVFGGGHVVLPLLRQGLVPAGWLSDRQFLEGYGLAQGIPGPLFSVAAYLGAVSAPAHQAALWATLAVLAIFLPGLLLAAGGASLWSLLLRRKRSAAALAGLNAAVVGILAAALYNPVWRNGVHTAWDAVLAVAGFVLLQVWRGSALWVVALCVLGSLMAPTGFL